MALIRCPECDHEISENAVSCPHCGNPINEVTVSYQTNSQINDESSNKNTTAMIVGFVIQIIGCIVFLSFNNKYIDSRVTFGGDYNTYTYQTLVYIATALRYGITGILIGIGALLQCSKTTRYSGNSTTTLHSTATKKANFVYNSNHREERKIEEEKPTLVDSIKENDSITEKYTVVNDKEIKCNRCGFIQPNRRRNGVCYHCGNRFTD